jgi:transposase
MIYVRQPTDKELLELKRMTRQEVGRVSQRAQMILLSAQRQGVPQIAMIFGCAYRTVRFWIRRFNAHGPAGLYDHPRSGRPRKADQRVQDTVLDLIQDDPAREGHLATFWTVAMLVLAVLNKVSVALRPTTLRALLHRVGLRWGRPRLAMPDKVDPEKASKLWAIVQAAFGAGPDAAILYADESRIQLLPLLRAMWHWVGEQLRIPTPGSNQSRALFGALNIRTGRWVYLVRERIRKEDFVAFLEFLLTAYPVGPIVLIIDNYSSHTAKVVQEWLAEQPRIHLLYLPKYCSHLNPVGQIWLQLKNTVAANRLYNSMKILLETVVAFFDAMTPEKALAWASA